MYGSGILHVTLDVEGDHLVYLVERDSRCFRQFAKAFDYDYHPKLRWFCPEPDLEICPNSYIASLVVWRTIECHEVAMITSQVGEDGLRDCFRDPIPEIFEAAKLLNRAVSEHLAGDRKEAEALLRAADMPIIGEWLDSIWLGGGSYRLVRKVSGLPPVLPKSERFKPRDATKAMKRDLVARDGHHCRLCGIPLVRAVIRKMLTDQYPDAARWTGVKEEQQHRGLQVMWLQYDHVIVHSRGGETSMANLVVTCPACNYGRDRYMMAEVGLRDPRLHPRFPSWDGWRDWDGLERVDSEKARYSFQG